MRMHNMVYTPYNVTLKTIIISIICDMIKGMCQMSEISILRYKLKEVTKSYVLHCLGN